MNNKFIVLLIMVFVSLGFVMPAQGDSSSGGQNDSADSGSDNDDIIGGQTDDNGCLIAAGYSWNETEQKCVKEWETGEERYQQENQEIYQSGPGGSLNGGVGQYTSESGKQFAVQKQSENQLRITSGGVSADCNCNMTQEQDQNRTKLKVRLSNGMNAEVKVMPDTASENALERLKLKVCSEENNCTIQLKEVGKANETQLAYEVQIQRHSRILGIFQKKMQVKAEVSAENGEIVGTDKPWWAFIASEPVEE